MNYLILWADQRPIIATLICLLILMNCVMLFLWRKDAEHLASSSKDVPEELVLKSRLFRGTGFLAIALSLVSIFVKF